MPPAFDALDSGWAPPTPTPTPTVSTPETFTLISFSFPPLTPATATMAPTFSLSLASQLSAASSVASTSLPTPSGSANISEANSAALFQLRTALYLLIVGCIALSAVVLLHGYLYYQWRRQRAAEARTFAVSALKGNDSTSELSSFASPGSLAALTPLSDAGAIENGSLPRSTRDTFAAQGNTPTEASSFPSSLSILAKPRTTRDRGTQTEKRYHRRRMPTTSEETYTSTASTPPDSPVDPSHTSRDTVGRIVAVYSTYRGTYPSPTSPSDNSDLNSDLHPDYTSTSSNSSDTARNGPTLTLQFPTPPSTGMSSFEPLDARALSRAGRNNPFSDFGGDGVREGRSPREAGSREGNAMLEQFLRSVVLDGEGGRESAIRTISHSSAGMEERQWFV
ncbi:unnamed protein product [Peniophora sp. CBMAI 1063]|nr:unnamed protein product [Peniophora sp. CBMAI 1063]